MKKPLQKLDQYEIMKGYCNCVFLFVGNTFRSDDGVGPYIAEKLSSVLNQLPKIHLINAKTNPENYIDEIIAFAPKYVVFVDAAQFDGFPGEFIYIEDGKDLPESSASTHTLPLNLIAALIKSECDCAVSYIGIQAGSLQLGERLSKEVRKAADLFIDEVKLRVKGAKNA